MPSVARRPLLLRCPTSADGLVGGNHAASLRRLRAARVRVEPDPRGHRADPDDPGPAGHRVARPVDVRAFTLRPSLSSHVLPRVSSRGALTHPKRPALAGAGSRDALGGSLINRQRRRLLLSSAAALASGVGLSAVSRDAAADQGDPSAPGTPALAPSTAPIFAPKPAWLGTFSPNSLNMGP